MFLIGNVTIDELIVRAEKMRAGDRVDAQVMTTWTRNAAGLLPAERAAIDTAMIEYKRVRALFDPLRISQVE